MIATDKDQPGTLHTKIKFTLRNGTDLFKIDPYSGEISAITNTLDREVFPAYKFPNIFMYVVGVTVQLSFCVYLCVCFFFTSNIESIRITSRLQMLCDII